MQITEKILIIDFGSQVTKLIARRIREIGVYCEIFPYNKPLEKIKNFNANGIILSGGPSSVKQGFAPDIDLEIFSLNLPILGICYGQQLLCAKLGGEVEESTKREFGRTFITPIITSKLTENIWQEGKEYQVWMSHGDKITKIPEGFSAVAKSDNTPFAVIANEENKIYGVQFHPEVMHTPDGTKLLENFARKICGCKDNWNMHSFLETKSAEVKKYLGEKKVICGVSGGVDSSVVAKLLSNILGDNLHCIFIDHGLLRKNEVKNVKDLFQSHNIPLKYVDAASLFLGKLDGVNDPEKKRKIIGNTFIDVFEKEAKAIDGAEFLAQGTLYPDVIESVSVHGDASVTIKSHHNVGGLPERMNLKLVEPLRELFKDEVRELGLELGLSEEMVYRHPFPGPGLAIRIPGEISQEKINILQEADDIYIKNIKDAGLYHKIWQAFAVLLPVKTVGVMGDGRTYEYVCALRAVTSSDGMTADIYPFSMDFLNKVSSDIINNVKGINRVTYDITTKPPGTIEWE